jgi:hypothetical protein
VDIYPADPFSEQMDFGTLRSRDFLFTVRARVNPVDIDATQQLLLQLMDPLQDTSVHAAIHSDRTLGGLVDDVSAIGPTGVIVYSPVGGEGYLVGCEWRTRVRRSGADTAPPVVTVPAAPTLTSATGGDTAVTLVWAPHATGGTPITGYKLYRGTAAGAETLLTTVGLVTAFLDDTVMNDTTYYYKVSALNTVGESSRSNELSATPAAAPPPAGLTLLDDFNRGDNTTLGTNWARPDVGTGSVMQIQGNRAKLDGTNESASIWTADTFGADQGVEVTLAVTDTGGGGAHLYLLLQVAAAAPAAFTGYLIDLSLDVTTLTIQIYRATAGTYATVGSPVGPFPNTAGDTWSIEKTGGTLTVKRNTAAVASPTDSSPLTGNGHAGIGGRNTAVLRIDDFKAGNL